MRFSILGIWLVYKPNTAQGKQHVLAKTVTRVTAPQGNGGQLLSFAATERIRSCSLRGAGAALAGQVAESADDPVILRRRLDDLGKDLD